MDHECCAVCQDELAEPSTTLSLPGCGHRFHTVCALNNAQYDARCPVCRGVGEGVVLREPAPNTVVLNLQNIEFADSEPDSEHEESLRVWTRWRARRARAIRRRPSLRRKSEALKQVRTEVRQAVNTLQRTYDARCKEVWKGDPDVLSQRKVMTRLRRKELRLQNLIERELLNIFP